MRFLFSSILLPGTHQMSSTLAQVFIKRGHRVMFLVNESIENFLKSNPLNEGFEYGRLSPEFDDTDINNENSEASSKTLDGAFESYSKSYTFFINLMKSHKEDAERHVAQFQPDLIILDHGYPVPYLMDKNCPWGQIISMNILSIGPPDFPPSFTGLSTKLEDHDQWQSAEQIYEKYMGPITDTCKQLLKDHNLKDDLKYRLTNESKLFNFYCLPLELDYFTERSINLGPNWFRFDELIRQEADIDIDLNELFDTKQGKLIYFSLGTLASSYTALMQSLIDKLAKIPHRFIVSTGKNGHQLKLPSNCVGRNKWPQTHILTRVDLYISHVGNNSFLEAMACGVPVLAMPVFLDQLDNAQRLVECDLGLRLNPFTATLEQISSCVEQMLNNQDIRQRMKAMSERIKKANNVQRACDQIEASVRNFRQLYGTSV